MSPSKSPDDVAAHGSGNDSATLRSHDNPNAGIPRQKRLACLICRRRKLKCDGRRPSCSTCSRLGHQCAYDEVRKKSGPKRGYVKALEERLKQVEVMLKSQDGGGAAATAADALLGFAARDRRPGPASAVAAAAAAAAATASAAAIGTTSAKHGLSQSTAGDSAANGVAGPATAADFSVPDPSTINLSASRDSWQFNADSPPPPGSLDDFNFGAACNANWELIQLGLEEPLPDQAIIDELTGIYFDKIHPSMPMIHRARYYAAMNLPLALRPPVCLRYAMWMAACSVTEKYNGLRDLFYQRARKYLEVDCMKGFGEQMISVAHCQTHIVLASYEFKMMYFPRAWMSTGQAIRLAQMIGLHRLDGSGLDVKQCLPRARDWTEEEERRRTFWMAFCEDRYASIGTGWPMTIDERDISTILPASEQAFDMSRPEDSIPLHEAMCPSGVGKLTPFAGVILMACLFGRNLNHIHRPDSDDRDDDLNGEFWKRHRNIDNILLNTLLGLPAHLKLPEGMKNPNIVFTNLCIYTSIICLHQAAIFRAEKNGLDKRTAPECKVRCLNSAREIASIMRMISHLDLSTMSPFIAFSLYVAARVFIQDLKSRPDESEAADHLRFLLTAMGALKRKNPLTESFLAQLDVDLVALGNRIPHLKAAFPMSSDSPSSSFAASSRPGAVCEDGAVDGILSFQKEYSKRTENTSSEGNAGDGHASREPVTRSSPNGVGANGSGTKISSGLPQQWSYPESGLPTRDRSAGNSPLFHMQAGGYPDPSVSSSFPGGQPSVDFEDMSTSPGDGLSSRPTPNSSSASEGRQNLVPPPSAQLHSAGSSFDAGPVSPPPPRGLVGRQQAPRIDHNAGPGAGSFYGPTTGAPHDYAAAHPGPAATAAVMNGAAGLGGIMTGDPSSHEYMIPEGWNIADQTAMTPVSEGVLRSIIQMGPMETMDLGWGTNP